jgi:hypothetical protein
MPFWKCHDRRHDEASRLAPEIQQPSPFDEAQRTFGWTVGKMLYSTIVYSISSNDAHNVLVTSDSVRIFYFSEELSKILILPMQSLCRLWMLDSGVDQGRIR